MSILSCMILSLVLMSHRSVWRGQYIGVRGLDEGCWNVLLVVGMGCNAIFAATLALMTVSTEAAVRMVVLERAVRDRLICWMGSSLSTMGHPALLKPTRTRGSCPSRCRR